MITINTNNLINRYSNTPVVDDLNLFISSGTIYGFLDPNGAGKTTIMRLLTSHIQVTTRTGTDAGIPITDRDRLHLHIGYPPKESPIYEQATAHERLEYISDLYDLPELSAQKRINTLLDDLALTADTSTRIAEYSKGMRQKIAYIQAVLHEPDIIFLDESTPGLDPRAASTIQKIINNISDKGVDVSLSTHIPPVVKEIADTIRILYDGQHAAENTPDTLTHHDEPEEKNLEDVFLELIEAGSITNMGVTDG